MATKTFTASLAKWRRRKERIRALHKSGKNMGEIGRMFGISRQRVRQILNGD